MTAVWLVPIKEIYSFIRWWLVEIPLYLLKFIKSSLIVTDDILGLGANLRLWLAIEPLFKDYTWSGRMVGFLIRGIRILASIFVYLVILIVGILVMLIWFLLPLFAIILIFR